MNHESEPAFEQERWEYDGVQTYLRGLGASSEEIGILNEVNAVLKGGPIAAEAIDAYVTRLDGRLRPDWEVRVQHFPPRRLTAQVQLRHRPADRMYTFGLEARDDDYLWRDGPGMQTPIQDYE